jgi:hypothetical protein
MYIFDQNVFMTIFGYYYEIAFPSFWEYFDQYILEGKIISVREVLNEIESHHNKESNLVKWAKNHKDIFLQPTEPEIEIVKIIFSNPQFQVIISKQSQLEGKPVADPFIIAKAKILGGFVVSNESYKSHGVKIPNICEYFNVKCINLGKFMEIENWKF